LTVLVNTVNAHAGERHAYTEDMIRAFATGHVRDPERNSRFVLDGDQLVGYAMVAAPPDGGHRIDLPGGVHPRRPGQGLGRRLLGWQLDRAAELHRAAAPGTPWEVHASVLLDDRSATRLFERAGLEVARYWFTMECATVDPPTVLPVPPGLTVTGYDPARERDLHAAHVEAFADHWGYQARAFPEWAALTVRSGSFRPELSFLAHDGDELAGYLLSYAAPDDDVYEVGHVGVRRPWRKRGLASALLSRALSAGRKAGYVTAHLGVDAANPTGAVGVYERVGFRPVTRAVTYLLRLSA